MSDDKLIKDPIREIAARKNGTGRPNRTASQDTGLSAEGVPSTELKSSGATVKMGAGVQPAAGNSLPAAGGSVRMRGADVVLDSDTGEAFVAACARNTEGLLTDQQLKEIWGLEEIEWVALGENAPLLSAIKRARERRIRSGEAAREAAQRHVAGAPSVLNQILLNETISPRHRIEAAKELRQMASNGVANAAASGEKFVISIDLGGDSRLVKEYDLPGRIAGDNEEEQ